MQVNNPTVEPMRRKLAAIMFIDIVSFSAMMQENETRAFNQGRRFKNKTAEKTEIYNGKVWQYFGDGALCIFDSAVEAVECAVALQREFITEPNLPTRIGIHTGDVIFDNENVYGDGINVAARIEPMCVPGGIYVSGKAFDEVKNHKWLKGISLGHRSMKNIDQDIEVYAIKNHGVAFPKTTLGSKNIHEDKEDMKPSSPSSPHMVVMYKKWVATLLSFFFGVFGAHKFYLGQRSKGIMYVVVFIISIIVSVNSDLPFAAIIPTLAFIDFLTLLIMPRAKFDQRYNIHLPTSPEKKKKAVKKKTTRVKWKDRPRKIVLRDQPIENTKKKDAILLLKSFHLEEAANTFQQALELTPNDAEIHFLLAKCYSLLEKSHYALSHLSEAIELGFKDFPQIHTASEFAHLRIQESFRLFVQNGYKLLRDLPSPNVDLLSDEDTLSLGEYQQKKIEKLKAQRESNADDEPIDWLPK